MDVVLWGATGQARVVRECLGHDGHRVVALVDNDLRLSSPFPGVPLLNGAPALTEWLEHRPAGARRVAFVVAVGGDKGNERIVLHAALAEMGLIPLLVRHPTAFVADNARLGEGCQVLAQAAVCVDVTLGRCCIVNTGAVVDHECQLSEGVHVGPGARLAGLVRVGRNAFVGTGAVVLPRVSVGEDAVVGAGAVVVRDVPPGVTVMGNPARQRS